MDHASPEDMRKETEPTNDVNRHRSGGLPWTLPSCFSEDLWQGDSKTVAATLNLQLSSASRGEQQQTAKVDQCRAQDAAQRGVEQNERRTLLQPMMLNSSALSTAGYDMLADAIACSAEFERSLRVHSKAANTVTLTILTPAVQVSVTSFQRSGEVIHCL